MAPPCCAHELGRPSRGARPVEMVTPGCRGSRRRARGQGSGRRASLPSAPLFPKWPWGSLGHSVILPACGRWSCFTVKYGLEQLPTHVLFTFKIWALKADLTLPADAENQHCYSWVFAIHLLMLAEVCSLFTFQEINMSINWKIYYHQWQSFTDLRQSSEFY